MNITSEKIDSWCRVDSESAHLEFKRAEESFETNTLYKYCVALANAKGGHLLLGITDRPPRQVVGSSAFGNAEKIAKQIYDKLNFRVEVDAVEHPKGRVVVFTVPPRPTGRPYDLEGAYWMRAGSSLTAMDPDTLKQIFAEGQPDWLGEICLEGAKADEIVGLLDAESFLNLMGANPTTSNQDAVELIAKKKLIVKVDGKYSVRRIGALLLAKNLADFELIEHKAPRVVVHPGASKLSVTNDVIGGKGYAVGFQGLVGFIMNQMPRNQVIDGALRRDVTMIPESIVRELVANALLHQDFAVSGARVMIDIYNNRLEVSNPGTPIVATTRFIDQEQTRNAELAGMLRRMRICEERGSGIDKVIEEVEAHQLPAPEFYSDKLRTYAVIYGPKEFANLSQEERIRACYQHSVLKWVKREKMTNRSLRERFDLPKSKSAAISQTIVATVEAGYIKSDKAEGGSRKYAHYLPAWA